MARDKHSKRENKGKAPPAETPPVVLNNPFREAKAQLQKLVKPPEPAQRPPPRAPVRAAPSPSPEPSDEDLFRQEMSGVRRLGGSQRTAKAESEAQPRERPSEEAEVYAELADLVEGNGAWDIADTDEYIEGIGPGLDRRLLQRLRKGDYAVQGHLDLHGMTREQAHERVDRYIQQSRLEGKRCVLIIHGRGINSKDQIPVLKERVRVWLTRGRISRAVLCYATARPVDGGAGAVYVLLRK